MEKAQSQKKERPKGTSSRAGDVYGRSSGQDSGTTAENVLLKATKSDKAISAVSEGPKSSPFSQDPNSGSPPQDASPKGAGLGAKGPTKPHSAKMPQARYHPSIQNPQVCTRNGTSQKSVRTKDCERSAVKKNHTGTDLESSSPQATSSRAGDGDGLNSGLSSEGPHPGTTPKGTPPKGKKQNGRSRASVLPQTGTRQEERNERTTGGDAPEPDDTVTPEEAPRGSEVLRLDPLVLRVGSTLDQSLVEKVEVLTRGQSTNPEWFTARKNRITASVAHNIAHCRYVQDKSTAPPVSYLKAITGEGPRVQTRAMTWGIENEKEAVQKYQELKSAALGRPVTVLDCGLFIDCSKPWLAASPDGIVTDGRTGQWLRSLEVKCPFKHRNRRVEEACSQDPRFCLEILEPQGLDWSPVFGLKRSHPYFTQVQFQMAVTGLQKADFVVFTQRDLAVVQVDFDPRFWEETVSRLERFYFKALVPFLREKSPQWNHEV